MSIKETVKKLRDRVQEARKGPLRPLDDNDREAVNFAIETLKNLREDKSFSLIELEAVVEAIEHLREARKDTPT